MGTPILSLLASDNFQRANVNPLTSPWTAFENGTVSKLQIISDLCDGAGDFVNGMLYSYSLPNDQYTSGTFGASPVSTAMQLLSRFVDGGSSPISANNGYLLSVSSSNWYLYESGPDTLIAQGFVTPQIGDVFVLTCIGTTIYVMKNGTVLHSSTDTSFSSGQAGLSISDGGNSPAGLISNFQIGSASLTPVDPSYDPTKPFLGSVHVVLSAPAGAKVNFIGTVVNIGATPPAGPKNPYLGQVMAGMPSSGDSNPMLGQVCEVASAPSGDSDPFLGEFEGT